MFGEFVESLKESYKERQLNCEEQWPPVSVQKLFNLHLVEAEKKEGFRAGLPQHGASNEKIKRTPILHSDLFNVKEGKKPVRKLIIEGNAGMGKTTLCTMLAEEWAEEKIFTQFHSVLMLPLRDQLVASVSSLKDLLGLYHPDQRICVSIAQQLMRTRGKGVLIIADGWDELSEEKRSKKSFLHYLLFGRLLPSVSVLLTSRPSASAPLHDLPLVNRLVEVVGFNEENVKQYIESEFEECPEKASSLIEQLENNSVIQSICSVPLNCAIICSLWNTLRGVLPSTLTELYTQIVLNIVLRNLKKLNYSKCPISLSFNSIPKNLQDSFWLICKFAYDCLCRDQTVFSEVELAIFSPEILDSSSKFLCFGLLQCARSLLPVGQGLSFHFVHLTIQEFLAALHLVTLPNEEKLLLCEAYANSNRFAMVWRFVFGLACKRKCDYSRKVICLDHMVLDQFVRRIKSTDQRLLLCQCSMESLNDNVCAKIAKQINGRFDVFAQSPHDCVAIFHVLQHTLHCSAVCIDLNNCGLSDKLLKELTDILSSAGGKLQVGQLSLSDNKLTDKGVIDLCDRGAVSFSTLQSLSLDSNSITDIMIRPFCSSFNSLISLNLSDNPLGVSGIQSLETAVQAGKLVNLQNLSLSNTLTNDADVNGALLATLLPAIVSHCSQMYYLYLSKNNLGIPGAYALGETFRLSASSRDEFELYLSETNISGEAASAFTSADMYVSTSSQSYYLNLSTNPLGCDGLLAIFKMLRRKNCPIAELNLCNADLTSQVSSASKILYLGNAFESSRLLALNLNGNDFSGDKVHLLTECMRVCTSLDYLGCEECSLSSSEVADILDRLESGDTIYKNLKEWDLGNNSIDDDGVTALIESLPELFPSLAIVHFMLNPASVKVKQRLQTLLEVNMEECCSCEEDLVLRSKCAVTVLTEWERTCSPQSEESIPARSSPVSSSEHSTTVDSPPPPSNDMYKSFHSATEELDGLMKPPHSATNESTPTRVQSPYKMDQQKINGGGTTDVTTAPQTTSPTHKSKSTILATSELTLSVLDRELETLTKPIQLGIKLGVPQHRIEIIQQNHQNDIDDQKIALFQFIAKNHKSIGITWSSIADALRDIYAGDLSLMIREKHCHAQ